MYFTALWETKSQASRDNGRCTFNICTHPEAPYFSLLLSSRLTKHSSLALSFKCIPSYHSTRQRTRKSVSRPWPELTLPNRQALTEADKMAPYAPVPIKFAMEEVIGSATQETPTPPLVWPPEIPKSTLFLLHLEFPCKWGHRAVGLFHV